MLIEKECYCQYCNKKFKTVNGKNGHVAFCKQNPNRKSAWNKGLSKDTDDRVKKYGEAQKITRDDPDWKAEHQVWNKGLSKDTDDRVKKYGEAQKITRDDPDWKAEHQEKIYKKYGGKHFTQTEKYKANRKLALLEKYGTDSIMDVPEIADKVLKSRYKRKKFIFPSGNTVVVQGYEIYALNILLETFNECDIIVGTKNVPQIYYIDKNNIKHRYYPDIFIKSTNTIIEVKSLYTITSNKEKNIYKYKATKDAGFNFECWIIDNEQIKEKIYDLSEYYGNGCKWLGNC